jgi:transcriptional regulator with XRE-family HTH domain
MSDRVATGGDAIAFGARLRLLREARGMTRETLGGLVGRSASWVKRIEAGTLGAPKLHLLVAIATALRVRDLSELTGDQSMPVSLFVAPGHARLPSVGGSGSVPLAAVVARAAGAERELPAAFTRPSVGGSARCTEPSRRGRGAAAGADSGRSGGVIGPDRGGAATGGAGGAVGGGPVTGPTRLAASVLEELATAQAALDRHVPTFQGRCRACGELEPCAAREAAGAVFARHQCLPRRTPGATSRGLRPGRGRHLA